MEGSKRVFLVKRLGFGVEMGVFLASVRVEMESGEKRKRGSFCGQLDGLCRGILLIDGYSRGRLFIEGNRSVKVKFNILA